MTAVELSRDQNVQAGHAPTQKHDGGDGARSRPAEMAPPGETGRLSDRFCIIGAGPSGLAAAKNFKQAGIPFDCFEANGDVGGMWNPASPDRAYATVHLNISKRLMQFEDFPIHAEHPDFMGLKQAFRYLREYADHNGLCDTITFNTRVRKVDKRDGEWLVWTNDDDDPRKYRGLIIANGHHWDPRMPRHTADCEAGVIHAHDYKSPDQLRGRKVLVVGGGNSGLDIACDAAAHAAESHHSLRRGYHIIPKLIFGRPTDRMLDRLKQLRLPRWMVRRIAARMMRLLVGPYEKYGLPKPTKAMFSEHPAASSQYLELLRHGEIQVHPDIAETNGQHVRFTDGREEKFDLIIYCTGYRVSMPFLSENLNADVRERDKLFLNLFHREDDSLYFIGLFQPADGGFWQLADYQAQLVTRYIITCQLDARAARNFRTFVGKGDCDVGRSGTATDLDARNRYAVDHYRYRAQMRRLMKRLSPAPT